MFLLLVSGSLTTTGMFMDGLIYSNVAANIAEGVGSFWNPTYTATHHPEFYQHPPLMMGMLAGFYKLLGVHLWVTKLYMVVTTLLCAWLTVRLWTRLGGKKENGWMPLLFWTLMPVVTRFANQCMIENTMLLFDLGAILLLLRKNRGIMYALIAGLLVAAAFMTKGFVGLFPLALPFLLWLFDRKNETVKSMAIKTVAMLVGLIAPLAVIALAVPQSREYFNNYMQYQVLAGWARNEDARWQIVVYFLRNVAIVAGLVTVVALVKKSVQRPTQRQWAMWALVACAVLPIMVSTRQNEYYVLPAMPLFAVLSALLVEEAVGGWLKPSKAMAYGSLSMLAGSLLLNALRFGSEGRDVQLQRDMKLIVAHLDEGETISIPTPLYCNYKLQGYYYREHRVTLDDMHRCRHFLTTGEYKPDSSYREVPLPTEEYKLYELAVSGQRLAVGSQRAAVGGQRAAVSS